MTVLKNDLRAMVADGASFSLMVGLGETYLPAFVLAVGLGEIAAGLVSTVPMLAGAVLQMVTPYAVARLKSYRTWVVLCATIQALAFVPLFLAALWGSIPVWGVFAVAAVYWGTGMATGPAWNAWAGTLVPARIRGRFFACRQRIAQLCVLFGFLAGGLALQAGKSYEVATLTFAGLFLAAGISRFASALCLARQSEPEPPHATAAKIPLREMLARLCKTNDGRLIMYLILAQTGVQISGPFFTPYMLSKLHFSYMAYVALLATALFFKCVALSFVGRFTQRYGARRLLWIGACGIVPLSSLWIVSDNFYYLLCVQMLSGCAWGIFELASFLVFFETVKTEERTTVLTLFNFANAVAIVAGSLLGGWILHAFAQTPSAYLLLFAMSGVVRLSSLYLLRPIEANVEAPAPGPAPVFAARILAVRPQSGSLDRPIFDGEGQPPAVVAKAAAAASAKDDALPSPQGNGEVPVVA